MCVNAIKQNAAYSTGTTSGSTAPLTFLTEDEKVMQETGKQNT